jgi:hypothetical protein
MHDLVRLYATGLPLEGRSDALRRVADHYLHTAFAADRLLDPQRPPIELDPPDGASTPEVLADPASALAWFSIEYVALIATQRLAVDSGWHRHAWQLAWR